MKKFGIDISMWQKGFDIEKAIESGVEFVILKIGGGDDGLYKDSCFDDFYKKCKELGIPVGCYYFGNALTMEQAKREAEHFYSLIKGKQFEFPVLYDVEANMVNLDKRLLTDICKYVLSYIEQKGYWVGMYASHSTFESEVFDEELKKYSHWVASWRVTEVPKLTNGGETQMWQFGGSTNSIRSNIICGKVVDQNYCYVDYPSKIKEKGLNGFGRIEHQTQPQPIKSQRKLQKGCNGDDVKELQMNLNKVINSGLYVDGSFGSLTDSAVRTFQKKYGLEVDGIYGQKSRTKMNECLKSSNEMKVGSSVKIKIGAKDLNSNRLFASFVYNKTYKVIRINGDNVVFGINNVITGVVSRNDVVLV